MESKIAESFYASPQQEHLWSLQQAGDNTAYRSQQAVLIEGSLDAELLRAAIREVVNRHEILRTTFHYEAKEGRLVQSVADAASLSIKEFSLSEPSAQRQETEINSLFDEMKREPFDFEKGPLLHVSVIKLPDEKHMLLVCVSALCGDAATVANLLDEICEVYDQFSSSDRHFKQPFQYGDFAQWQREVLESDEAEAGRRYWRGMAVSLQLDLDLPFKARSSEAQSFEPSVLSLALDKERAGQIELFSRVYKTTPQVFLLTAWVVLLWRMTGRGDLVAGVRCDGRKYAELDKALGLFARYLPLHCNLESNLRFEDVLKRIHQSAEDIYRWQDSFSWEQVIKPKSREALAPFCAANFEFARRPAISVIRQYECIERFEVKLSCIEKDDGLNLDLHFDGSLFQADDIRRLSERLQVLIQSALANPRAHISELQILSDLELHRLLVEFNHSENGHDTNQLIHELFEKQVLRTPDATALIYEDQHLTYESLNNRANQLAHHLRQLGVGPEVLVALCTERGIDMMIGLLAVLKAGGAYVPLDPGYPKERLAYMLDDSRCAIMLTQSRMANDLSQMGIETICMDSKWEWIRPEGNSNLAVNVGPQNLVYVIYTSGSTGKPKGVAVEHRQLVNYSISMAKKLNASEGAGFAALSTLAADLGNTAIFPSLITGGQLHIISQEIVQDAHALGEYFQNHHIEYLKMTPSHLAAVHASRGGQLVMPRETLILGGEALSAAWVRDLAKNVPPCKVINHYGPTETTVGTLTYDVKAYEVAEDATANVPLGPPISNALAYILDGTLGATPVGMAGEIYLGGEAVSRGYLNRPDLTAEKFIPNPFARRAGNRMYRTGDLARHRADGAIDFLGRIDYQVKIRGFRIELGEIESALAHHPAVRNAVLLAREDRPGTKRLVAYLEPARGELIRSEEMWSYLKSRLPEYMVPSEYVVLEALPLMANGKVDRRALPAPEESEPGTEANFVAARTEVEDQLARIWAEVLGLERVSVDANFFRLGGDSILSIQIVSRAREAGYYLTARDVFEHKTIAALAKAVSRKQGPKAEQGIVRGDVSLTPIQRRFFEHDFAEPHHWNQSLLLEARQRLIAPLLKEALGHLLRNHDALRLRYVRGGLTPRQINAEPDDVIPFAQVDLSTMNEPDRTEALESIARSAQASLDLSEGPLLRMVLFNFGDQEPDRLLIIIHHLVVDVVSWHILIEDLQSIYKQLCSGEAVALPAKTTSYKQWAQHLIDYSKSSDLLRQADYWLANACEDVDALPVDYSGGINSEGSTRVVSVSLDEEETESILREIPEAYRAQIDDVLLAALALAFARLNGSRKLLVDIESHGRQELFSGVDLSRTVGWFTAIFPLLLDACDWSEPVQALKSVKEQLRRVSQRGIDYGLLRYLCEDAEVAKKLRAQPGAQVSFNYVGQFDQAFSGASLFEGANELSAPSVSPRAARAHLLDIIGRVAHGRLQFSFRYSENVHRRATIERLGEYFLAALRSIITHRLTGASGSLTPSDFPDVELSQEELDQLMAQFG